MDIGISSACFYPNINLEDSIKLMKSLGFNKGEVFFNCPSEFTKEFSERLLEESEKSRFIINSVHAFSSSFEPYIFDSYKRRKDDMLKYFKDVCKAGKTLGAKSYTFHGMRKIDNRFLNEKHVIDTYNELIYISEEIGIKLAQENVSWCMSSELSFLEMLQSKCKHPISFTLDIKQAYRAGISPESYIDVMGKRIVNLHLNDRDDKNSCLIPGKGMVDYSKIFKKLKDIEYRGIGILEVYSDNFSEYKELIEGRQYLTKIQ
ncbi:TIM barrel protein [Clostridium bovifaecis]|uniref:TIM barrel protein n=1 Tax=Clostridium bovifaecis TaxID=2184719 RepID=A0A6I6EVS2_9CLOT|nr:TIM barrel protein [Clostridium bovifaecis]